MGWDKVEWFGFPGDDDGPAFMAWRAQRGERAYMDRIYFHGGAEAVEAWMFEVGFEMLNGSLRDQLALDRVTFKGAA